MIRTPNPISELRSGERAFALPLAMIVLIIVLIAGLVYLEIARQEGTLAAEDVSGLKALQAATAGIARARTMSTSQNVSWSEMTLYGSGLVFARSADPAYDGNLVCELFSDQAMNDENGSTYSVVIEDLSAVNPSGDGYRIHSYGQSGPRSRHITVEAVAITFSSFAWLSNKENGLPFVTGDRMQGWVHSNDRINISGSPLFNDKVSSAASSFAYKNGGPPVDNPTLEDGAKFNASPIDIAALVDADGQLAFVREQSLAPTGIHLGPNDGRPYHVDFLPSGKITISKETESGGWEKVINGLPISATNGAIYIEEDVQVEGTVNGQITLGTPAGKDIDIISDLLYDLPQGVTKQEIFEDDFNPDQAGFTSKVALVAGGNVNVRKSWTNQWGEMYIMASIIAVTGSFQNKFYKRHPQKTLHFYGSLAQNSRGPVGTTDGNGLLRDYKYDKRLFSGAPPHIPTIRYDYDTWTMSDD